MEADRGRRSDGGDRRALSATRRNHTGHGTCAVAAGLHPQRAAGAATRRSSDRGRHRTRPEQRATLSYHTSGTNIQALAPKHQSLLVVEPLWVPLLYGKTHTAT